MFVRDESFVPKGTIGGKTLVAMPDVYSLYVSTGDVARFDREVKLNFRAYLCEDSRWRIHMYADCLPSQTISGFGDPLVEFIKFRDGFLDFFAKPAADRVLPWEEI